MYMHTYIRPVCVRLCVCGCVCPCLWSVPVCVCACGYPPVYTCIRMCQYTRKHTSIKFVSESIQICYVYVLCMCVCVCMCVHQDYIVCVAHIKATIYDQLRQVLIMITWEPGTTGRPREGWQGGWANAWRGPYEILKSQHPDNSGEKLFWEIKL